MIYERRYVLVPSTTLWRSPGQSPESAQGGSRGSVRNCPTLRSFAPDPSLEKDDLALAGEFLGVCPNTPQA